jgi:amino acid transporter
MAWEKVCRRTSSAEISSPDKSSCFPSLATIGTGLVIGSGTALSRGGPASLLISYLAIDTVAFLVMTALGEMSASLPMNRGFGGYATRIVDPTFGYDLPCTGHKKVEACALTDLLPGYNCYFKYIITTPTNLATAGLVIPYWRPGLNVGIWTAVFGLVIISINVSLTPK